MATLAESLVSSSSRPIRLRMRPDLSRERHRYHGQVYWVVKEPVGLNYFRFHEEEYAILCMLDGNTSMDVIKERFEAEFAPQKITYSDLQQFIGMLHRSGLVIAENAGQGWQLLRRRDEKKRRELLGKFANIFALRFRGIDPDRLLTWLHRYTAWLFAPLTMLLVVLFGLSALTLVFVQFDMFRSRLPTFHEFFGPSNWIYLGTTMAVVKVLHEFGHGLSCKHYGGECHEMGAMLLVFTPALYCNVSDSWMLPNKWHRAFIGAAGMYVEIILASIATYLWWFSEPGLLNHVALSVMFICSVSTVMFNGNPLLRFDGYYILMDLTEIPNLRQKATELLRRFMVSTCLGLEQPENPFLPQRNQAVFALYTIAAVCYRWVVTFSILWFLNKVLEPYGLKIVGQLIAAAGFVGLIVQPVVGLVKFFWVPGRMNKVKKHRLALTVLFVAAVVGLIGFVPFPFWIDCALTIEPRDAAPIYPPRPGRLLAVNVEPMQHVHEGAELARLESEDLRLNVQELEGTLDVLTTQRTSILDMIRDEPSAGAELAVIDEQLDTAEQRLLERRGELEQMTLRAPRDGFVLPPPAREDKAPPEGQLPAITGSPLDPKNHGAYLRPSEPLCRIGDPTQLEAVLVVDQGDIDLISIGNKVDIRLDGYPLERYHGSIAKFSEEPLRVAPPALSTQAGGSLETATGEEGLPMPLHTSYPASVPLDDENGELILGLRGRARVHTAPRTLWSRFYRYIARTFNFEL